MDNDRPFPYGKQKSGSFRKNKQFSFRKRTRPQLDNGRQKRHNFNQQQSSTTSKPADTLYRILCPVKKIGSVLGKGGSIVNSLREETHAKIRVVDSIPGAEERVVIIFNYLSDEHGRYDSDQDPENSDLTENEHFEDEQMRPHCPAQDALLKVHDRIVADEYLHGGVVHENNELDGIATARLLVPSNQVGCLIGKGGDVIQKLRSETGANIRILPSDHLPACAMRADELVQISGVPTIAKKALYEVSTLLHQHPRKENPPLDDLIAASTQGLYPSGASVPPSMPHGNPIWSHQTPPVPWFGEYGNEPLGFASGGFSSGRFGNGGEPAEEFSIRIVCSVEKIGGVIGKGGVNVRQIEQQTGASIHVEDTAPDAEERVILVSSKEAPWEPTSPTVQAILQLQSRTSDISEKGIVTTRLLVPSSKVGCLIGEGGHIITEMRRRTRADIRVHSKDDKPKFASANEELVQISGNHSVAKEALSEISSRLRARTLQVGNPAPSHVPSDPFHGFSPSRSYSGRGLPSSGMIGAGNSVGYDHYKSVGYDHYKGTGQKYEAPSYPMPPPAAGYPNFNSSVEVKIPNSAVASVLGTGGSNISDIRQISGARVKLHDPMSGASECVVEIHGSSEQTNAAQSLLQAFISSGGPNQQQNVQQNLQHYQGPRAY